MPDISDIQEVDQPLDFPDLDASNVRYRSPDGSWELIFSRPGEIAMGASVWGSAALYRGDKDVSSEHSALIPTHTSINDIPYLHPWNHQSTELVVPLMSRKKGLGAIVYDVSKAEVRRRVSLPRDSYFSGLIWSPVADLILLLRDGASEIVSGDFTHVRSVSFGPNEHSTTLGGWTPSGAFAFALCRQRFQSSVLRFFDAESAMAAEVTFDPDNLLPYDKDRFRELSRGGVLVDPSGISWSAGMFEELLGYWAGATYDSAAGVLSTWAYRPTFETVPYPARRLDSHPGDGFACVIRPRWIHVRVTD